jgi:hypothetical protein
MAVGGEVEGRADDTAGDSCWSMVIDAVGGGDSGSMRACAHIEVRGQPTAGNWVVASESFGRSLVVRF